MSARANKEARETLHLRNKRKKDICRSTITSFIFRGWLANSYIKLRTPLFLPNI